MGRPKKQAPNRADGLYEVKITIGKTLQGKLIRKSFYSSISKADARKQAEAWKIAQAVAEQAGEPFITREVTFGEWAVKWLETYKKPNVRPNTYSFSYYSPTQNYLIPYFGKALLQNIRPIDVQTFYNEKCAGLSMSMVNKIKICLNAIFETAVNNDLLIKSPSRGIQPPAGKPPAAKRTYTKKQAYRVKQYAYHHPYGLEIILLLELGLRRSELLGLRWDDFDLYKRTVSISRSVYSDSGKTYIGTPKTKTSIRTLPISTALAGYLSANFGEGYLFPNNKQLPRDPENWDARRFKTFMKDLHYEKPDIPILNPHELRHTCGTLLYQKSHDIRAVSRFLGHATIDITSSIYVHDNIEDLKKSLGFI